MIILIKVIFYCWVGYFGFFKVNIFCGECIFIKDILVDIFVNELVGVLIELEVKDWFSYWWEFLKFGVWYVLIVVVVGKVIS